MERSKVKYIHSTSKRIFDIKMFIRIYISAARKFGLFNALKEIKTYTKSGKNIFQMSPNRYIKQGKNIIAIPDVPPLNSKDFVNYILDDIEVVNRNKQIPLIFAIFCVSSRCPYKCAYCYNSDSHTHEETIQIETIEKTISGLIDSGVKNIHLSGGEPMTRYNDVNHILKKFKNKGIGFWLLTTGWEITKDKLLEMQNNGLRGLLVSLDSDNAQWVNKIKGSQKAFSNATNTIKIASELGLIVSIDSVINRDLLNQEKFEKYIKFLGSLGAKFINCYAPRKIRNHDHTSIDAFAFEDFKRLEKLAAKTQKSESYHQLPIANSPDAWEAIRGCMGGKLFIYIDPEGNVKACPFISKSFGNIKNKDIKVILQEIKVNREGFSCKANEMLMSKLSNI